MSRELKRYLKSSVELIKNRRKIGGYCSLEDFVYKNGQSFKPRVLSKNIERGKMKECYRNAALLAMSSRNYFYVEGYALGCFIPTMHAWCIDKNKNVIDSTWDDGKAYFGVVFKRDYLFKHLTKYKRHGLIDAWQDDWPLFNLDKEIWLERGVK